MRYLLAGVLCLMAVMGHAETIFPAGCKPIVVADEPFLLVSDSPTVVLIHNVSSTDLWITHPVSDPGASAGWSSRLQAGQWSALTLQDKSFELSCIESKPGHEQQVPCAGVLAVCEWKKVALPKANKDGTYWAAEDLSLPALSASIGQRGFVLPTPTEAK